MLKKVMLVFVLALMASRAVQAEDVAVTDFNWLNMAPDSVVASVGSSSGVVGNGYGPPECFRWGGWVWMPTGAMTDNGAADYWAIVSLDQLRNVNTVKVQIWASESTSVTKFYIDGSADGTVWTELGSVDYGAPQTANWNPGWTEDVTVPDADYQYIKDRFMAGDYGTDGTSGFGGPGLLAIQPVGDGTLQPWNANWASTNFGTIRSINDLDFTNAQFNSSFINETGERSGASALDGSWPDDAAIELDFGELRNIDRCVVVWESSWNAQEYDVLYYDDAIGWLTVTGMVGPDYYAVGGATGYSFDAVQTDIVRIVEARGPNDHFICNEIFFYAASTEPWLLPGDVNGDCKVNILDLIGIRNHLNADPTTPPENAIYDVTLDGAINILDMIFVRNRLNTVCEE